MSKKLKVLAWEDRKGLTRRLPLRMVKMIQPRCETCEKRPGWYARCEHDPAPYFSMQAIDGGSTKTFNEESGQWEDGPQKILGYKLIPNVIQVPLTMRIASGMEVERHIAMGCKFPEDVQPRAIDGTPDDEYEGYAKWCEFQNCYSPNPKVKTRHPGLSANKQVPPERQIAWYCTEDHARRARLKDSTESRYVPEANEESAEGAREQLARISL